MIDFDELMLRPIYATLGVTAKLLTEAGDTHTLTVIDRTEGVEVALVDVSVPTLKPAVAVRVAELTQKNVAVPELDDGQITFNGRKWRINGSLPQPGPEGEGKGEVYLLLTDEKAEP